MKNSFRFNNIFHELLSFILVDIYEQMNKLQAIFKMRCPRCRKGKLFVEPFKFSKPLEMPERCSECGQLTEPEPGYYFGAMFISYIWTGWLCIFCVGFTIIFLKWSVLQSFAFLIGAFLLSYFWVMRISRSIYINLDVPYDPNWEASNAVKSEA